jgi:hypothetical protein
MNGSPEKVRGFVIVMALGAVLALGPVPSDAQQMPPGTAPQALKPGQFVWDDAAAPSGPLVVLVSLSEQFAYVYRNGIVIGYCPVATGKKGHETPTGVFTILQKDNDHVSNLYNAKMPYTERLTWSGICLHSGSVPGYPNSHGCIHLPDEFARRLYGIEELGGTVVIADDHSGPAEASHPGMVLSPVQAGGEPVAVPAGFHEYEWRPELSPTGPVSILISGQDRTAYVYRNGVEIGSAALHIDNPEQPLAEGVFAILEGHADHQNPWVPGRPAPRWMAVWTDVPGGLDQATDYLNRGSNLNRVHIPAAFTAQVYEILEPGSSVVITNRAAAPEVSRSSDFVVMASRHPEQEG